MEVLLSFGSFKVYTLSVFVVLAFLWAAFVTSKRADEYHLDRGRVFDLSVVAFIFGGLSFKAMSLMWGGELGFWYFVFGLILGVVSFALWNKWEIFEILDVIAPGILMGMAVVFLGLFASSGNWMSLVSAAWYFAFFIVCFGVEYKYRFWEWYKVGKSSARSGLGFSLFLVVLGLSRIVFEIWISMAVLLLGLILVYVRSGRSLKADFFRVLHRR